MFGRHSMATVCCFRGPIHPVRCCGGQLLQRCRDISALTKGFLKTLCLSHSGDTPTAKIHQHCCVLSSLSASLDPLSQGTKECLAMAIIQSEARLRY